MVDEIRSQIKYEPCEGEALIKNYQAGQQNAFRAGETCPKCKNATLNYDGLLMLVCPQCGVVEAGCFT